MKLRKWPLRALTTIKKEALVEHFYKRAKSKNHESHKEDIGHSTSMFKKTRVKTSEEPCHTSISISSTTDFNDVYTSDFNSNRENTFKQEDLASPEVALCDKSVQVVFKALTLIAHGQQLEFSQTQCQIQKASSQS